MCDTILATPRDTAEHIMLFGKNSDRQRNEAQAVEYMPACDFAPNARLSCTYLTIPQVPHTHAVLLARPFWIWGAEMGANEHAVTIGNEGLHARCAAPQVEALTGMDLVRLALERAATAREAVQVITALLEQYGQGGNCGHPIPSYYNNGFLIADPGEAFVLETVGREWLLERVGGIRSLSNIYSVTDAERVSAGLHRLIRECGWSDHATPRYADVITHPNREHIGQASARRARSALLLRSRESRLDAAHMMSILRDHGVHQRAGGWNPENAAEVSLCMHAGELNRAGQTVGSWVSELYPGGAVHWVTGTAAPCISIFKPVLFPAALPSREPSLTDRFDPRTLWWRHERLHRRALLSDFAQFLQDIQAERDGLETKFRGRVSAAFNGASHGERSQVIAECWSEAEEMEDRWCSRLENQVLRADSPYRDSWVEMSHNAGMDVVSWAARFRP